MNQFLKTNTNISAFLDENDKSRVLEERLYYDCEYLSLENNGREEEVNVAAEWYLNRARDVHATTMMLEPVLQLCDLGLSRCISDGDSDDDDDNTDNVDDDDDEIHNHRCSSETTSRRSDNNALSILRILRSDAALMQRLLINIDTVSMPNSYSLSSSSLSSKLNGEEMKANTSATGGIEFLSLSEFSSLGYEKIVDIILCRYMVHNGTTTTATTTTTTTPFLHGSEFLRRCRLLTAVDETITIINDKSHNRGDVGESSGVAKSFGSLVRIEERVVQNCHHRLSTCVKYNENNKDNNNQAALDDEIRLCINLARDSSVVLPRDRRILKNNGVLVNFVLFATRKLIEMITTISSSPRNDRGEVLVEVLWGMYECLPSLRCENIDGDKMNSKEERKSEVWEDDLNNLYLDLSVLELATRWGNFRSKNGINGISICPSAGNDVLVHMCKGLCKKIKEHSDKESKDFLLCCLADAMDLNKVCFACRIPTSNIIERYLLSDLLHHSFFHIIFYLFWTGPRLINSEIFWSRVVVFLRTLLLPSTFAHASDKEKVKEKQRKAICCLNVLESVIPKQGTGQEELWTMYRYVHVMKFLRNVSHCDLHSVLNLTDFQSSSPLTIIDRIMNITPRLIVADIEWRDKHSCNDEEPGIAVFRLAEILGMNTRLRTTQIVISCIVVKHSIISGMYNEAKYACDAMLYKVSNDNNDNLNNHGILNDDGLIYTLGVVSCNSYQDNIAKKALCIDAISWYGKMQGLEDEIVVEPALDIILRSFSSLELALSCTKQESKLKGDIISNEASEFLIFRAANLVAKKAKNIASTESREIFATTKPHDVTFDFDLAFSKILESNSINIRYFLSSLHANVIDERSALVANDPTSTDEILKELYKHIIHWCTKEATGLTSCNGIEISVDSRLNLMRKMIQLGTVILMEVRDNKNAFTFIDKELRLLEEGVTNHLEAFESEGELPSCFIPDEDIVRKLCECGYSINGARRSAIKTRNEGFNMSMIHAVAHSLDVDFNDPMLFLKKESEVGTNERQLDQKLVSLVRDCLLFAHRYVSNSRYSVDDIVPTAKQSLDVTLNILSTDGKDVESKIHPAPHCTNIKTKKVNENIIKSVISDKGDTKAKESGLLMKEATRIIVQDIGMSPLNVVCTPKQLKAGRFDKCTLVGSNSEIVGSNREIETPISGIDTKLEREKKNPTNSFIKCTNKLEKKNDCEVAPRDIESGLLMKEQTRSKVQDIRMSPLNVACTPKQFKAGGFDKCTLVGNNSEIVDSNREIETPMTGIDTKLERERENPTNRFIKCTDKLEKKNKFEVAPRDIEKSDLKHNLLSINLKAKEKNKSVYVHAREGIKTISQQPPETTGFNPSTSNSHFSLLERARSLHL